MTQPTGKGTLVARKSYSYKKLLILAGDETNGANIPRVFWFIFPPFHPDTLTATFAHDILCQKEKYALADQYFDELLKLGGTPTWKRWCLVAGVKSWHKIAYDKDNQPYGWLKLYRKLRKV